MKYRHFSSILILPLVLLLFPLHSCTEKSVTYISDPHTAALFEINPNLDDRIRNEFDSHNLSFKHIRFDDIELLDEASISTIRANRPSCIILSPLLSLLAEKIQSEFPDLPIAIFRYKETAINEELIPILFDAREAYRKAGEKTAETGAGEQREGVRHLAVFLASDVNSYKAEEDAFIDGYLSGGGREEDIFIQEEALEGREEIRLLINRLRTEGARYYVIGINQFTGFFLEQLRGQEKAIVRNWKLGQGHSEKIFLIIEDSLSKALVNAALTCTNAEKRERIDEIRIESDLLSPGKAD